MMECLSVMMKRMTQMCSHMLAGLIPLRYVDHMIKPLNNVHQLDIIHTLVLSYTYK